VTKARDQDHQLINGKGWAEPFWLPFDFLLLVILVGIYFGLRPALPLPQVVGVDQHLTALAVLLVVLYWIVGYRMAVGNIPQSRLWPIKYVIIFCLVGLVVIAPIVIAMQWRAAGQPFEFVHDGLIQSEAATEFVRAGLNPYEESYEGTPMADWPFRVGSIVVNPALNHYPYLPLTFLISLPFSWIGGAGAHSLDQRWIYVGLFLGALIMSLFLVRAPLLKATLLMSLGLNPTFIPYFIEGRNDILPLFFIILTLLLLTRKRFLASSVALALACGTKQFAWIFVPFFFAYISDGDGSSERLNSIRRPLIIFGIVFAVIVLPWFALSPGDFVEDTLLFQAGLGQGAYPISGFGVSALMLSLGWLQSAEAATPLSIVSVLLGIPILILSLRHLLDDPSISFAVGSYAFLLGLLLFLSRAFNDNYIGYLTSLFILAAFLQFNDQVNRQQTRLQ